MIRYLSENDIKQLLTMPIALECAEQALRARALGDAIDVPRARIHLPTGTHHVLQAAAPALKCVGFKYYYTTPHGKSFYVHLIDTESGRLEAIIEAVWMSMVRTGAASGIATNQLAVKDASVVGQIGAGFQGIGQLEAVCQVRKIRTAQIFARNRDRLQAFCSSMSQKLGIEVVAAPSVEAAVRGAHVVNVITKSAEPVLKGEWLEPGQHVNAAGSNALSRRELDDAAVKKCNVIAVDSRGTASKECGDLLPSVEKGWRHWDSLTEMGEVITGKARGRSSPIDITLYESHGMGILDLWVGARMLELARKRGIGTELPIGG
ncbi:MAG: ornithine cyclodeaminase family protein [Betaproteobacteria bacterium]|nr:ornithine cyclodeaminase family protein [Betaproteobacteria bacterium]MDH3436732.1 ornithine cyclodeaminase family protein [Betaproteobacteria bacterium]